MNFKTIKDWLSSPLVGNLLVIFTLIFSIYTFKQARDEISESNFINKIDFLDQDILKIRQINEMYRYCFAKKILVVCEEKTFLTFNRYQYLLIKNLEMYKKYSSYSLAYQRFDEMISLAKKVNEDPERILSELTDEIDLYTNFLLEKKISTIK